MGLAGFIAAGALARRRKLQIDGMVQAAKPRIRWNAREQEWTCSDTTACFAYAWGDSREEAYGRWERKFRAWAEGALQ